MSVISLFLYCCLLKDNECLCVEDFEVGILRPRATFGPQAVDPASVVPSIKHYVQPVLSRQLSDEHLNQILFSSSISPVISSFQGRIVTLCKVI